MSVKIIYLGTPEYLLKLVLHLHLHRIRLCFGLIPLPLACDTHMMV